MCGFSRKIAYALTFTTFLAVLFFVIGTGTPNWIKGESDTPFGTSKFYFGLTKSCSEPAVGDKTCETYDFGKCNTSPYYDPSGGKTQFDSEPCDKFKTTQGLSLLACLLSGLGLFILVALIVASTIGSVPQVIGFLLVLAAGVCGMIAMSTYADLAKDFLKTYCSNLSLKCSYDFSFALVILGWIFSYITFVLAFFTGAASGTAKISGST